VSVDVTTAGLKPVKTAVATWRAACDLVIVLLAGRVLVKARVSVFSRKREYSERERAGAPI